MPSTYSRLTFPSLPDAVLSASALRRLRALYAEQAQAEADCHDKDAITEDAVADILRAVDRFDHDGEAKARTAYATARTAASTARRHLADVHSRGLAEIIEKRDVLRPLLHQALADAHATALTAVAQAKSADHAQRATAAALRDLDVVTATQRPNLDPEDLPILVQDVAATYDTVLALHDRSASRRHLVGLSWRDVTESVAGLPVEHLTAVDGLAPDVLAPTLVEINRRQTTRSRLRKVTQ